MAQVDQKGPTEKEVEACSEIGMALANAEAWVQGDVLVRLNESFDNVRIEGADGPSGVAFSAKQMRRFIFDMDEGRYLQAVVGNLDGVFLPQVGDSKEMAQAQMRAAIASHKDRKAWRFDPESGFSKEGSPPTKSMVEFLTRKRLVDFRAVWMAPHYGKFFTAMPFELRSRGWEQRRAARDLRSFSEDADGGKVFEFANQFKGTKDVVVTKIHLDAESQMPIEIKEMLEKPGRTLRGPSGSIRWELKNEIYVPVSISVSRRHSMKIEGVPESGTLKQELKFHWFAINEALAPDLFDPKNIDGKEAVYKLVDPVHNSADTLVEKKSESKTDPSRKKQRRNAPKKQCREE